jgi:tetratricopeptide (TPR) repeat protein
MQMARCAYDAGDYNKAVEELKPLAEQHPDNSAAHFWLARAHYEMRQWDAAIAEAERAVALETENSFYHLWLGRAYGMKAEHLGAFFGFSLARKTRKELEEAVQLDPHDFAAQQDLIEFYCRAPGIVGGGEEKARRSISELAQLDPAEALYARANCARAKKHYDQADAEFDRALENKPARPDLLYAIAEYEEQRNHLEPLRQALQMAAARDAADPREGYFQGIVLVIRKERPGEAERLLKAYAQDAPVREGFPRLSSAYVWLGRLYEGEGRLDAALAAYRAALESDPKNKVAHEAEERLRKLGRN